MQTQVTFLLLYPQWIHSEGSFSVDMAEICSEICLKEIPVAIYYFLGKEKKNLSWGIKVLPTLCQAAELTVLKNALVTILISG